MTDEEIEAKLRAFMEKWKGKPLYDTGTLGPNPYGAQCVNLVNEWLRELGIDPFVGDPVDWPEQARARGMWVSYGETEEEMSGDG